MAEGLRVFRKLQLGLETTAGTAVAATIIVRHDGTMEDGTQRNYVDESVGYFVPTDRSYEAFTIARLSMGSSPLTFEQLPYILTTGVKQINSGSADGVGTGKIYTYPFSTTAANTLDSVTLEAGNNQQAWEAAYGVCTGFEISGSGGGDSDAIMMSADWIAREWTTTTYTSLGLAAVEEMMFPKAKLYIDAIDGTMGSTQVIATMVDFSLRVDTGVRAIFTGDGFLYFTDARLRVRPEIKLELGMLYNSTTVTEISNWLAGTSRQIEIKLEGSALGTAGAYTYKTIKLQLPGSWEKFSGLDDVEGGDHVTGTFRSGYNTTSASGPQIIVVNENATL